MPRTVSELTPTEFENLTYDILQAGGMKSLVWRTPGADGGRDIEGIFPQMDFSGYFREQRWYIECKQYSSAIGWPIIWEKVAYAMNRSADFLLLVTTNNPSPNCETEITHWNVSQRTPTIRVWRGYELDRIIASYPGIAAKHGLTSLRAASEELSPLLFEIMKIFQSTYVSQELGRDNGCGTETASALTELAHSRMDQVRVYGKIVRAFDLQTPPVYDWLEWNGPAPSFDEIGFRALLTTFRYLTAAEKIQVTVAHNSTRITAINNRLAMSPAASSSFSTVALWADIEVEEIGDAFVVVRARA